MDKVGRGYRERRVGLPRQISHGRRDRHRAWRVQVQVDFDGPRFASTSLYFTSLHHLQLQLDLHLSSDITCSFYIAHPRVAELTPTAI